MGEPTYFIRLRGRVSGPFTAKQLQALHQRGQFSRFHEISEDRKTWITASTLAHLFPGLTSEPPLAEAAKVAEALPVDSGHGAGARKWHYLLKDNRPSSPISQAQLLDLLRDGTITRKTQVWNSSMAGWQPLGSVAELSEGPFTAPAGGPAAGRGLAVSSLVCGLVWLGGLASLAAVVLGALALRRTNARTGPRRLAWAGMALGVAGLVLAPPAAFILYRALGPLT